jgi:hypothetical protein
MTSRRSSVVGIGAAGFEPARVSALWLPMPVRLPISPRPDRSLRKPAVGRGVPVPAHSPTQGQPGSQVGVNSRRPGSSLRRSHLFVSLSLGVQAEESPRLNPSQFGVRSNLFSYVGWSANADREFGCHRTPIPWWSGSGRVERSGPKFLKLTGLLLLSLLQSRIIGKPDSRYVTCTVGFANPALAFIPFLDSTNNAACLTSRKRGNNSPHAKSHRLIISAESIHSQARHEAPIS